MLTCKDVATQKEKGTLVSDPIYFDRVYLEYGPSDPVEDFERKITSKTGDKTEIVKKMITRPKGADDTEEAAETETENVSVEDPNELLAAAISGIQVVYPDVNPVWKLLSLASKQYANLQRAAAKVAAGIVPTRVLKPKDPQAAFRTMAQNMVQGGMAPDLASAYKKLEALGLKP
jgi:hypothetical protein